MILFPLMLRMCGRDFPIRLVEGYGRNSRYKGGNQDLFLWRRDKSPDWRDKPPPGKGINCTGDCSTLKIAITSSLDAVLDNIRNPELVNAFYSSRPRRIDHIPPTQLLVTLPNQIRRLLPRHAASISPIEDRIREIRSETVRRVTHILQGAVLIQPE